jgi:hypothetical protein
VRGQNSRSRFYFIYFYFVFGLVGCEGIFCSSIVVAAARAVGCWHGRLCMPCRACEASRRRLHRPPSLSGSHTLRSG